MRPVTIGKDDKLLIIAPHPDDECIGTGGMLSLYPDNCSIWVLTDGSIGQGDKSRNEIKTIRKSEFEAAMNYAGIKKYRYFDIPDGELILHLEELCLEDLSKFKYIFVTSKDDGHPDHKAAYMCVKNALEKNGFNIPVYGYEVHSPIKNPTHYIDISDVVEKKRTLISFHESQNVIQKYDNMAVCLSEYRGHQHRMSGKFLEAYEEIVWKNECQNETNLEVEKELQKQKVFYRVLTSWINAEIENGGIREKIIGLGYRNIAIYGYAEVGKLLFKEIKRNIPTVNVTCVLDKKGELLKDSEAVPIIPDETLKKPDAVIVTTALYFNEICNELSDMGYVNIFSLQELLDGR